MTPRKFVTGTVNEHVVYRYGNTRSTTSGTSFQSTTHGALARSMGHMSILQSPGLFRCLSLPWIWMLGCAALDDTGTLDDNSTQLWVPLSLRVKESSRWFAQWLAIRLSWSWISFLSSALDHSLPLRVEGLWHRSITPASQRPSVPASAVQVFADSPSHPQQDP